MSPDQNTMLPQPIDVRLRSFGEADYPRVVELGTAVFPDEPWSEEGFRHWDASWDHTRYERHRVVAEDAAGRTIYEALQADLRRRGATIVHAGGGWPRRP